MLCPAIAFAIPSSYFGLFLSVLQSPHLFVVKMPLKLQDKSQCSFFYVIILNFKDI